MEIKTAREFLKALKTPCNIGGYTNFFTSSEGTALCETCAIERKAAVVSSIVLDIRDGDYITMMDSDSNYDSGSITCDNCSCDITAYPEEEE